MTEDEATPYRGLMPFLEEDAPFFFGRDREREIITANLLASRLTLLYGESGVGKSSVLHAGVVHKLRRLAGEAVGTGRRPDAVIAAMSSWRDDPVLGLLEEVQRSLAPLVDDPDATRLSRSDPVARPPPLVETLDRWTREIDCELLVVLDQFEEYFLYHSRDDGSSFADELARAVTQPGLRVNFLISIREDALAQLDRFKGSIPNLFQHYFRIDHLTREAAQQAIRGPLDQYNKRSGVERVTIEPELVNAVLKEVEAQPGTDGFNPGGGRAVSRGADEGGERIETPYLQLVMTQLWDEEKQQASSTLRLSTLKRLGEGRRILHRHLDARMKTLTSSEQDLAERFFHYLVTPSGTKIAHTVADLGTYAGGVPVRKLTPVLDKLAAPDARILRSFASSGTDAARRRYEIFHDLLARPILDWRNDHAAVRYRRRLRRGGGAAAILLIALAAVLVFQSRRATSTDTQLEVTENKVVTLNDTIRDLKRASASFEALLSGHVGPLRTAAFSDAGAVVTPRGNRDRIVTSSDDGTARVWRPDGRSLEILRGHKGPVTDAAFGRGKPSKVVTAGADGTARLWNALTGGSLAVLRGHRGPVNVAAFSPDGSRVLTAGDDGTARVWNARTGAEQVVMDEYVKPVVDASFARDGRYVVTASADGTARVWDGTSRRSLAVLRGHRGVVLRASFGPATGSSEVPTVVTVGSDGTARIWSWSPRKRPVIEHVLDGGLRSAAFNSDGTLVVTGATDGTALIWSAQTGKRLVVLRGHSAPVNGAAFAQDDYVIGTAGADGAARIWEGAGASLGVLGRHAGPVAGLSFSGDGRFVVTHGRDPAALVWQVPVGSTLLGGSADGEPIRATRVGPRDARRRILVVGCVYGNECAGIAVAQELAERRPPRGYAFWIVENLNPDGFARDTRTNGHGVNINRNFPFKWQRSSDEPGDNPGPRVLSEPESRFAKALIERVRPEVTIMLHVPRERGRTLVAQSGEANQIERAFAGLAGACVEQISAHAGSIAEWQNATFPGTTAFSAYLPYVRPGRRLPAADVERFTKAVLALAQGKRTPQAGSCPSQSPD
jgi:WD40 repeat protein